MSERWLQIDVERALYVDRGIDVILCDRFMPSPATLVVKMTDEAVEQLRASLIGGPPSTDDDQKT